MSNIVLYSAQSANGKIARNDGGVDWLETIDHPEGEDYGYADFYASIGTTIMGNKTYQQLVSWGIEFPYKGKSNFVLTRNKALQANEDVQFITSNHISHIAQLKSEGDKDIWLIGGGQINTMLLNAGLLDQVIIHTMPIIIPNGIDLFEGTPNENLLVLINQKQYSSGVIETNYQIQN